MSFDEWYKEVVLSDYEAYVERVWTGNFKQLLREVYEAGQESGREDKDYEC